MTVTKTLVTVSTSAPIIATANGSNKEGRHNRKLLFKAWYINKALDILFPTWHMDRMTRATWKIPTVDKHDAPCCSQHPSDKGQICGPFVSFKDNQYLFLNSWEEVIVRSASSSSSSRVAFTPLWAPTEVRPDPTPISHQKDSHKCEWLGLALWGRAECD